MILSVDTFIQHIIKNESSSSGSFYAYFGRVFVWLYLEVICAFVVLFIWQHHQINMMFFQSIWVLEFFCVLHPLLYSRRNHVFQLLTFLACVMVQLFQWTVHQFVKPLLLFLLWQLNFRFLLRDSGLNGFGWLKISFICNGVTLDKTQKLFVFSQFFLLFLLLPNLFDQLVIIEQSSSHLLSLSYSQWLWKV